MSRNFDIAFSDGKFRCRYLIGKESSGYVKSSTSETLNLVTGEVVSNIGSGYATDGWASLKIIENNVLTNSFHISGHTDNLYFRVINQGTS